MDPEDRSLESIPRIDPGEPLQQNRSKRMNVYATCRNLFEIPLACFSMIGFWLHHGREPLAELRGCNRLRKVPPMKNIYFLQNDLQKHVRNYHLCQKHRKKWLLFDENHLKTRRKMPP